MTTPGLRSAIAEAVEGFEPTEGTDEPEATADEEPTPDASPGGESADTPDDGEDTSEATVEGTDEEVPTEYFGLDLSGLEPKQRAEIIGELRKRDDHIGKLLRDRNADSVETEPETGEPETPSEPTDEEILSALGLDPENNPFDEQAAKVALPLVKRQLQQDRTLAALIEQQELAEIDRSWRQSLSGLEREFGPLPADIDHDKVMEFAAESGIGNPVDAYWRIVGPGRAALTDAMKRLEKEQRTAAKKAAATTRPKAVEAEDDPALKATTVKGATREVARRLLADLGLGS